VPDSPAAALLTDFGAEADELARLRWQLRQVVTLADDAPALTDQHLRARLLALAETCA
jgi:hypothetical protein